MRKEGVWARVVGPEGTDWYGKQVDGAGEKVGEEGKGRGVS